MLARGVRGAGSVFVLPFAASPLITPAVWLEAVILPLEAVELGVANGAVVGVVGAAAFPGPVKVLGTWLVEKETLVGCLAGVLSVLNAVLAALVVGLLIELARP